MRESSVPAGDDHGRAPSSASRRRLLHGGIAGAPVLLTLISRPVLGSVQCAPCSNFSSLTGSQATKNVSSCSGYGPDRWASIDSWPSPFIATGSDATPFHCSTTGLSAGPFSQKTMRQVMKMSDDGGTISLGRYISAALLNARSGRAAVLSQTLACQMWNDCLNLGYFEPTAGVRWEAPEIVAYIKTTIG